MINTEIVPLSSKSKVRKRILSTRTRSILEESVFYARSINAIVGGLPRTELHRDSRYYLQSKSRRRDERTGTAL